MKRFLSFMMVLMVSLFYMGNVADFTFAATNYTPIGGTTTIKKNLVVESDSNIPDINFGYTINSGTPVAASTSTIEILASDQSASIGTASFSNDDTSHTIPGVPTDADPSSPTAGKKYAQKSVTVSFPNNSFTKPGVYRYVIHEVDGAKPGVTYDDTARYLDVFVVANPSDNTLSVDSYALRNVATNIGTDGEYTSDPNVKIDGYTNSVTQYDFDFSKTITGNQGDKNKRFTFTVNISNAIPGTYPVESNDVTGNPSSITIGTDGTFSATYDLTNGSTFKINNLNKNAICTIQEDAQDYSPSHKIDGGATIGTNNSGNITLANDSHSVAFTNTRQGIIPTGVLLIIAPFAVGILLFGAICIWMMAKRNREAY